MEKSTDSTQNLEQNKAPLRRSKNQIRKVGGVSSDLLTRLPWFGVSGATTHLHDSIRRNITFPKSSARVKERLLFDVSI
jgi:hypothetical protein